MQKAHWIKYKGNAAQAMVGQEVAHLAATSEPLVRAFTLA
jgi:hypothetical protein